MFGSAHTIRRRFPDSSRISHARLPAQRWPRESHHERATTAKTRSGDDRLGCAGPDCYVIAATRQSRTLGLRQTLQLDDFFFTPLQAERLPADLSKSSEAGSRSDRVSYLVRLKIENRARRVPFKFSGESLAFADLTGKEPASPNRRPNARLRATCIRRSTARPFKPARSDHDRLHLLPAARARELATSYLPPAVGAAICWSGFSSAARSSSSREWIGLFPEPTSTRIGAWQKNYGVPHLTWPCTGTGSLPGAVRATGDDPGVRPPGGAHLGLSRLSGRDSPAYLRDRRPQRQDGRAGTVALGRSMLVLSLDARTVPLHRNRLLRWRRDVRPGPCATPGSKSGEGCPTSRG